MLAQRLGLLNLLAQKDEEMRVDQTRAEEAEEEARAYKSALEEAKKLLSQTEKGIATIRGDARGAMEASAAERQERPIWMTKDVGTQTLHCGNVVAKAVQRVRITQPPPAGSVRFYCDECTANFKTASIRNKHTQDVHHPEVWRCAVMGGPSTCLKQMPSRRRLVGHWQKAKTHEEVDLQWSAKKIKKDGHGGDPKGIPLFL